MCKTFILITQEAEKVGVKHLPIFLDTLYSSFWSPSQLIFYFEGSASILTTAYEIARCFKQLVLFDVRTTKDEEGVAGSRRCVASAVHVLQPTERCCNSDFKIVSHSLQIGH